MCSILQTSVSPRMPVTPQSSATSSGQPVRHMSLSGARSDSAPIPESLKRATSPVVSRTPTLSTVIAHVEYVCNDDEWGWWCWDWKDPEAFRAECIAQAAVEMMLRPEEALPEDAEVTHGYVRESKAGDEYGVSLSERPNGGHRATFIWGRS